jgi:hypothetical protein
VFRLETSVQSLQIKHEEQTHKQLEHQDTVKNLGNRIEAAEVSLQQVTDFDRRESGQLKTEFREL